MSLFKNVADIQTADMLKLPVPEAHYHNIALKPSEYQKEIVASLAERAEKVRNREVDSSVDIAAMEGITPSQAGKSIHAALRRLRRYFARQKWTVNL